MDYSAAPGGGGDEPPGAGTPATVGVGESPLDGFDVEELPRALPEHNRVEAAMKLFNIKASQAAGETVHSSHHSGHKVRRLPASRAEQRQEELAAEEAREAEVEHRVVRRGSHLSDAEKRSRREKASRIHRAAVAANMIEQYGEETRRHAMKRAANARVPVERMWAAEDDFALLTETPEDTRPGNLAEARKSRQYAAQQAAACVGRCRLCDARQLHGGGGGASKLQLV